MERLKNKQDLAGEHPIGDAGQLVLLIVFLAVWVFDSFIGKHTTFLAEYIPRFIRIPLSAVIILAAIYLSNNAHRILFDDRRATAVLQSGVFEYVRHPLYLAALLFYLGLLLLTLSILSAMVWLVIIAFYNFIAKYEEKLLLDKFGEEYKWYMLKVPKWIPLLKYRTSNDFS